MGRCVDTGDKKTIQDLIFVDENKGYNKDELEVLVTKIDSTMSWLQANVGNPNEDVMVFRVGVPTLLTEGTPEVLTAYERLFTEENTYLMSSFLNIDYIKITSQTYPTHSKMYHYASEFRHKLYGTYFEEEVHAVGTGTEYFTKPMLENVKSKIAFVPVQYNGVTALHESTEDLPEVLVDCMMLISQNSFLVRSIIDLDTGTEEEDRVLVGDQLVITITHLLSKLAEIRGKAVDKINRIAPENYQDIKDIMDFCGYENAFDDLKFGGVIDAARILFRIPASVENEQALRGLIELSDVAEYVGKTTTAVTEADINLYFNYVFPTDIVEPSVEEAFSQENVERSEDERPVRYESLRDTDLVMDIMALRGAGWSSSNPISLEDLSKLNTWFDLRLKVTDYTELNLLPIPSYSRLKGCRYYEEIYELDEDNNLVLTETIDEYRHFRVNYLWMKEQTIEKKMILYYLGIDLQITTDEPCPLDQIIMVIIIIILAILTWGYSVKFAPAMMQYAFIISTVISIGLAAGVWTSKKDQRNLSILSALLSTSSSVSGAVTATSTLTASAIITTIATIISGTVSVAETYDAYRHQEYTERASAELSEVEEAVKEWEGTMDFTLSGNFNYLARGPEADPYAYLKDQYDKFSTYTTDGFS